MCEGDREYFYQKLDEHFHASPARVSMKQKYIKSFGNAYECNSPNHSRLYEVFRDECRKYGILYKPDEVFSYMYKFEQRQRQMTLFDVPEGQHAD